MNDTDQTTSPAGASFDLRDLTDEAAALAVVHQAMDYRGDVAVELREGGSLSGYLYDYRAGESLDDSRVRLLPDDGGERVTITVDRIATIRFSDRDPAAGRSFETWLRKYVERKARGETASMEPEPLDE